MLGASAGHHQSRNLGWRESAPRCKNRGFDSWLLRSARVRVGMWHCNDQFEGLEDSPKVDSFESPSMDTADSIRSDCGPVDHGGTFATRITAVEAVVVFIVCAHPSLSSDLDHWNYICGILHSHLTTIPWGFGAAWPSSLDGWVGAGSSVPGDWYMDKQLCIAMARTK